MGKHSEIDIDAMLKRIQENVEKQSELSQEDTERDNSVSQKKSPDELLNMIMADIGESEKLHKPSSDADKYDISGFEIEAEDDEPEVSVDDEVAEDDCQPSEEICADAEHEIEEAEILQEIAETEAVVVDEVEEYADKGSDDEEATEEVEDNTEDLDDELLLEDLPDILGLQTDISQLMSVVESPEVKDEGCDAPEELVKSMQEPTEVFEEISVEKEEDEASVEPDCTESVDESKEQDDTPTFDIEFVAYKAEPEADIEAVTEVDEIVTAEEPSEPQIEPDTVIPEAIIDEPEETIEEDDCAVVDLEEKTSAFLHRAAALGVDESLDELRQGDVQTGIEASEEYRELDEADINLSVSLGNKNSLEDAIGFVRVREAKHNFVDTAKKKVFGNVILDRRNGEYREYSENGEIKDKYRKEKKRIGLRLIFVTLIFALLLFFETVYSFNSVTVPFISDLFSKHLYYGIVSVVLCLAAVSLSAKKVFYGLLGFLSSRPNYYSTISFVFIVNLFYSVLMITVFGDNEMLLLNSVVVFGLLLNVIGEYMQISREMLSFALVSDDKPRFAIEPVDISSNTIKRKEFLTGNEFVIENVNFVGKYFERSSKTPQSYYIRYTYTTLTMLFALLIAVISVMVTKDFSYFVFAFELSVVLCIPIQFVSLGALPFYLMSKKLFAHESAVLGETIDDEYVGPNTVYLDDLEVFGRNGLRVINLEPYNNFTIVDVYYYYLSVFSKLDNPMKNAFGEISDKMKISDNVKLGTVFKDGIDAIVDEKNKILIGRLPFMFEKEVHFGKCPQDEVHEKDDVCVLYMAINGALCARMYVKYSITEEFEQLAKDMAENKVQVGVRTIDPNVTADMLVRLRGEDMDPLAVIRPSFNDLVPIDRRSNSGVITAKNPHMIAQILAEGLKVKKINSVISLLWVVYAFLGMAAVITFSLIGIFDRVLPAYIVVYQFAWILGLVIYILNKLRNGKNNE